MVTMDFLKQVRGTNNNFDKVIACWISNILSPPIVVSYVAIWFIASSAPNPYSTITWLALILTLIFVMLPPLTYVIWLVRRGDLSDFSMPDRSERLKPLVVIITWLFICVFMLYYWGAPYSISLLLIGILAQSVILGLITVRWKISFHSAAISAAAALTMIVEGISIWPAILIFFTLLVGWARVRLGLHDIMQVLAGSLVGACLVLPLATNF